MAIERIKMTKPKLIEYQEMVRQAETVRQGEGQRQVSIADLLSSNDTSIVQGLVEYASHQDSVNDRWMEAFRKLLLEHAKSKNRHS